MGSLMTLPHAVPRVHRELAQRSLVAALWNRIAPRDRLQ
jgi:hypothetical protein